MKLPNGFPTNGLKTTALLSWMVFLAPLVGGQQQAPETFGETVDVYVVNIEVRVTDRKKDRPVSGLTAESFTIKEDGRKVEITNFVEIPVRAESAETLSQGSLDEGSVANDDALPQATVIFLIDDYSIYLQHRQSALSQLRDVLLDGLDAKTYAALAVYNGSLDVVEQPTRDRERLVSSLDTLEPADPRGLARQRGHEGAMIRVLNRAGEIRNEALSGFLETEEAVRRLNALTADVRTEADRRRIENARIFAALGALIDGLAQLPGRKALVYISEGLAMRPGQAELGVIQDAISEITASSGGGTSGSSIDSRSASLGALADQGSRRPTRRRKKKSKPPEELFEITALAANAGVSFYPWKGQGNVGGVTADVGGEAGLSLTPGVRGTREESLVATLSVLAEQTGGKMAVGTGLRPLVEKALADFGGYYSLGFTPVHGGDDQLHRLKVKVGKRGVRVWHAKSYVARPLQIFPSSNDPEAPRDR